MNEEEILVDKSKHLYIIKGICIIFFYLLAISFSDVPLDILGFNYKNWDPIWICIYDIIYQLIIIIVIFLTYKNVVISNCKDFFKNFKSYISEYIKYWFITLGLMMLSNLIIQPFTKSIAGNEETVRTMISLYPAYMFIASVIIAPIIEESIFRLVLRKMITNKYIFIFLSGFLFGFMHVLGNITGWTDWLFLIPYSIPGLIFAYTLVKSDNIFVPISLHTIHNCLLVSLQILFLLN